MKVSIIFKSNSKSMKESELGREHMNINILINAFVKGVISKGDEESSINCC